MKTFELLQLQMKIVVSIIVNSIIEVVDYRIELLKIALRLHLFLEDHLI